jgi:L-seryl-tRNA(Ser) seleniumtransferase
VTKTMSDARRRLPSIGALLEMPGISDLALDAPRSVVTAAARAVVDEVRAGTRKTPADDAEWTTAIGERFHVLMRPSLRPIFNATGVVLHTNLGRAPLPRVAMEAIRVAASGYSNLEYDLDGGQRGSRYVHCVSLLRELTGAEDAIVVNNGAAAMLLTLTSMCEGREAIVSRGELVEIGGSFRIPDIMARSGAKLVEVGTTNRTHFEDYQNAITPNTAALVKVHRSNFVIEGFVTEVSVRDLAPLAAMHGIPVLHDLGSGLLIPLDELGLGGEPTAGEALREGASVVVMSGDKLLGGPQAGIIIGTAQQIGRFKKHPLARSVRVDKLTIAALEAVLSLYRDRPRAMREIPTLALLGVPVPDLRRRATAVRERLQAAGINAESIDTTTEVGAGAFPTRQLPSAGLAIVGRDIDVERKLRAGDPPVISRIMDGRVILDLRSVPASDDQALGDAIVAASVPLASSGAPRARIRRGAGA